MNDLISTTKTMSSKEIAELTGKEHKNVIRDIESMLNELGIARLKFELSYLSPQNKELKCYNLPKRECDILISGYSIKYRTAIIDRWHELEATPLKRLTSAEAMIATGEFMINQEAINAEHKRESVNTDLRLSRLELIRNRSSRRNEVDQRQSPLFMENNTKLKSRWVRGMVVKSGDTLEFNRVLPEGTSGSCIQLDGRRDVLYLDRVTTLSNLTIALVGGRAVPDIYEYWEHMGICLGDVKRKYNRS